MFLESESAVHVVHVPPDFAYRLYRPRHTVMISQQHREERGHQLLTNAHRPMRGRQGNHKRQLA